MADAVDLKSTEGNLVRVQPPLAPQSDLASSSGYSFTFPTMDTGCRWFLM